MNQYYREQAWPVQRQDVAAAHIARRARSCSPSLADSCPSSLHYASRRRAIGERVLSNTPAASLLHCTLKDVDSYSLFSARLQRGDAHLQGLSGRVISSRILNLACGAVLPSLWQSTGVRIFTSSRGEADCNCLHTHYLWKCAAKRRHKTRTPFILVFYVSLPRNPPLQRHLQG